MFCEKELNMIKEFIKDNPKADITLGVDSQRMKKKRVKFAVVVVVHYAGGKGAKLFYDVQYEKIQDAKLSRPFNRMMKEVQLVTDVYTQLEDVLFDKDFAIHLDINPVKGNGSNVAYSAAKGMIYGMVGIEAVFKPNSWAASTVADRFSK